jgi:S-adenosyl methyltransferase
VIVGSGSLGELVDFSEPVAFLLIAVLHFIREDEDPYGIVSILKSVMAPGSYLIISHDPRPGRRRAVDPPGTGPAAPPGEYAGRLAALTAPARYLIKPL